jgi:hypothetical protein
VTLPAQQPEQPLVESLAMPTSGPAVVTSLIRQLIKVGSTMLYSVGYDEMTQMLEVVFYSAASTATSAYRETYLMACSLPSL